jgi:hypothetical protein
MERISLMQFTDRSNLHHLRDQAKDLVRYGAATTLVDARFQITRQQASWQADILLGSGTAASLSQVAVPSAEDVRPHDYFLADTNSCSSRGPCRLKAAFVQGIHDVGGEEIPRFCG